jgi:hypothetical protein
VESIKNCQFIVIGSHLRSLGREIISIISELVGLDRNISVSGVLFCQGTVTVTAEERKAVIQV